jgi:hypothetical protein
MFSAGLYALENTSQQIPEEAVKSWLSSSVGFEKNYGQVGDFNGNKVDNVLLRAKLPGYGIFITDKGVSYVIYRTKSKIDQVANLRSKSLRNPDSISYARIDLELLNANIKEQNIEYEEPLEGYTNYYLPQCPDGILGIITYKKIRIKNIYPGIDWVFKYEDGKMHHEFEVSPYADVSNIKIKVKYADINIEDRKKLILSTPLGKIVDGDILAYEGERNIPVSYKIEDGLIGFTVKKGSKKEKLVIDPPLALAWATDYGGSYDDYGYSITADGSGNIFLTGETNSINFPTYNPGGGAYFQGSLEGVTDIFILKFTNDGIRQWATYYGGSSFDHGRSITTDSSGNIFLTGFTYSTDFPTYDPGSGAYFQGSYAGNGDIFILKFTNDGIRQWATYYGGSGGDYGYSITADGSGNIFLTGETNSPNFPTYNPGGGAYSQGTNAGNRDAFILKFTNNGIREWATYFGGSYDDYGYSIKADNLENIFLTGSTGSTNFPTYNPGGGAYFQGTNAGYDDVFILKFTNNGVLQWATYYGGSVWDFAYSITADGSGNIFLTGMTHSSDFPTYNPGGGAYYQRTNAGYYDVFILKFTNSGIRQWATYYGGSDYDEGFSIIADVAGNIFLTGWTSSTNLPTYDPGGGAYYQGTYAGWGDIFILKFTNSGTRQWATYYGGSDWDEARSITADGSGNIFLTGWTGYTYLTNFPTHDSGWGAYFQGLYTGATDVFISKFEGGVIAVEENTFPHPEIKVLYVPSFFEDKILLRFSSSSKKTLRIILYNLTGEIVFQKELPHTLSVVLEGTKIKNLKSGIYFLKVFTDEKELGKFKLIKK